MALTKEQLDAYIQGLYDDDGNLYPEDYQKIINYIISNGEPDLNERDLIQVRRGDAAALPTLAQGELGYTLDNEKLFIGGISGNVNIGHKKEYISVLDFGAKGDGTTDDTTAFENAILNCPRGGLLYIPNNTYLITRKLVVNKNMSIIGDNIQDDTQNLIELKGSVLKFVGQEYQGAALDIEANGVRVENVMFVNESTVATHIQIGVNIKPYIGDVVWNITLKNVWVKGFGTHNIYASGLLLSTFEHVYSSHSVNGFYFDNPTLNGTSVNMLNCWSLRNTGYGYYFYKYYYCNLSACATDDIETGYAFVLCKSISLNGCGSELSKKEHISISNSESITLNAVFGYDGNKNNAASNGASFMSSSNSDNITLIGCKDLAPANGTLSLWSEKPLVIINCDLPQNMYINNGGYNNEKNAIFGKVNNIA